MTRLERTVWTASLLSALAVGCADRADGGGEGTSQNTETGSTDQGGTTEESGDGGGESGDGDWPDGFCEDACATPNADGCLSPQTCNDYCEAESPAWSPEVGDAFAVCVAEDPLCFSTVEDCILGVMHEAGDEYFVRLTGSGLGAHDGRLVRAWHDPDRPNPFGGEVEVVDGGFGFEWIQSLDAPTGPLLLLYVDVDDDGQCDPDVDLTASVHASWDGDYLNPGFEAHLDAPLGAAAFVCDSLP